MVNKNLQLNTPPKTGTIDFGKYIRLCLYVTLICNFFILLGNPLQNDFMVSWATRCLILLVFAASVLAVIKLLRRSLVGVADICFLAVIALSAIRMLMGGVSGIMAAAVPYLCFVMLPGYIVLYRRADNINRLKAAVYVANVFYTVVYVYLRFTDKAFLYYGPYGATTIGELTLGYDNPNQTGIYLMLSFFIMLSAVFAAKKRWQRRGCVLLCGALCYLLWETECRTCIVLAAVVLILTIFKFLPRLKAGARLIVFLIPLVSLILVRTIPDTLTALSFMGDVVDTGRYLVFDQLFSNLTIGSFLFGDVVGYAGTNMHNSYLSLLAMFGILTTIMYVMFLSTSLKAYCKKLSGFSSYVAYAGVLAVIVHGAAEGTLIISGTVYAGMAGLLFLLMLPEETDT